MLNEATSAAQLSAVPTPGTVLAAPEPTYSTACVQFPLHASQIPLPIPKIRPTPGIFLAPVLRAALAKTLLTTFLTIFFKTFFPIFLTLL